MFGHVGCRSLIQVNEHFYMQIPWEVKRRQCSAERRRDLFSIAIDMGAVDGEGKGGDMVVDI